MVLGEGAFSLALGTQREIRILILVTQNLPSFHGYFSPSRLINISRSELFIWRVVKRSKYKLG